MVVARTRNEYFPVYHVAPYEGNEAALGFDLASSKTRLKAIDSARVSGLPAATAKITLVQEEASQFGFLVFSPGYKGGQGSAFLYGFVLAVYRIDEIIERSLSFLRSIPALMLTTSESEGDIASAYDLGCNSYIAKPVDVPQFVEALRKLGQYWLDLVALPSEAGKNERTRKAR